MWRFRDRTAKGATGALCYMSHVKAGGSRCTMALISLVRIFERQLSASRAAENGGVFTSARKWPLGSMVLKYQYRGLRKVKAT